MAIKSNFRWQHLFSCSAAKPKTKKKQKKTKKKQKQKKARGRYQQNGFKTLLCCQSARLILRSLIKYLQNLKNWCNFIHKMGTYCTVQLWLANKNHNLLSFPYVIRKTGYSSGVEHLAVVFVLRESCFCSARPSDGDAEN